MLKKSLVILTLLIFGLGGARAVDLRAHQIEQFLSRYCPTSPLRGRGAEIVQTADRYRLDYRLYLAIAGAESTWGKNCPKRSFNYTGISNGGARFRSISHNIDFTHATIAQKKWYRHYRQTGKLMDLIYVYKGVPPYDRYYRSLRFTMDIVASLPVTAPIRLAAAPATKMRIKPAVSASAEAPLLLTWHTTRYDRYGIRKLTTID